MLGMNRDEFDCPHWAHQYKQVALQQDRNLMVYKFILEPRPSAAHRRGVFQIRL